MMWIGWALAVAAAAGWAIASALKANELRVLRLRMAAADQQRHELTDELRRRIDRDRERPKLAEELRQYRKGLEEAISAHMDANPRCGCSVCCYIKLRRDVLGGRHE